MKPSYIEAIKTRQSIRSYSRRPVRHATEGQLRDYLRHVDNPFAGYVRFELVKTDDNLSGRHLGTYGVIANAGMYMTAITDRSEFSMEALGYTFEKAVLKATMLGLGTCWLGGTFNKGVFAEAAALKDNEILPAVSPVGIPASRPTLLARTMGKVTRHHTRKPFEQLFFNENWQTPLTSRVAGKWEIPLEMVRLAPSSRNCQPWRVLINSEGIHFFLNQTREINRIDIGIALCHFDLACQEKKISGRFWRCDAVPVIPKGMQYVISWFPGRT